MKSEGSEGEYVQVGGKDKESEESGKGKDTEIKGGEKQSRH